MSFTQNEAAEIDSQRLEAIETIISEDENDDFVAEVEMDLEIEKSSYPSSAVILKRLGINLLIPFINGVFLGFGEIFAHELGLFWGWRTASVYTPQESEARRRWLFW
ncbi:hypothetical protein DASB73_019220 [Starmerella bacillaris]|uniref:Uncharacterized protein n=1 Tax=Starmerella bacillaris TaxID=1247836 RepID=A0AAV5RH96_STABA|nr:hypothetical protein DASB73_019220 [Starmerella bacillaris]